uniref:Regulating synaptic membrane exocytosis protein 2 n=1 Tax=Timema bartmani TaxID=61472 RepID=A0A7R9EQ29_9NEOP|nr:unnamed protein product [Timema bartmani]
MRDHEMGKSFNGDSREKFQVSSDGTRMIGHMILKKTVREGVGPTSSAAILGLKVVGGKLLENGGRGALIEKVKKGSTADIEGQLRPGDEVIEWNGRSLQGKSFQEVYDIIAESKQEPQVELIVSRSMGNRRTAQAHWRHTQSSPTPTHKDVYEGRRDKPSVLVTSPGSPDLHMPSRSSRPPRLGVSPTNSNVGGRMQIKLWFDSGALQLVVTVVCAAGLAPRSNGAPRNPYAKLFLLPDRSEKSKRRTKTLANTNDPKWNQTFIYSSVRRADLKLRILEVTVWDYVRYGANDFLGEVVIELSVAPLDEEPEWYYLTAHEEVLVTHGRRDIDPAEMDLALTPTDHLSPPSTTSRLSDSDTSECDLDDGMGGSGMRDRRVADGASISSVGSSSSPPPEVEMSDHRRSRRDMSPQGRKRAAVMMSRDKAASYQPHRKNGNQGMMTQRSHSAAPTDSPSLHSRSRSKSPRRMGDHRSLSPPEGRIHHHGNVMPSHAYVPRFASRSATATPTGSPKKRQLPQIPHSLQKALKERMTQDMEERARMMKQRMKLMQGYRSTGMGGWERHYTGLSDSDLPSRSAMPSADHKMRLRHSLSPDKDIMGDFGDSDIESVVSVTSSAFSTQSERPRGSRGLSKPCNARKYCSDSSSSSSHDNKSMSETFVRKLPHKARSRVFSLGIVDPSNGHHAKHLLKPMPPLVKCKSGVYAHNHSVECQYNQPRLRRSLTLGSSLPINETHGRYHLTKSLTLGEPVSTRLLPAGREHHTMLMNVASLKHARSNPHYYGYDSEYSGAETEIHCSDRSFDSQSLDMLDHCTTKVQNRGTVTGFQLDRKKDITSFHNKMNQPSFNTNALKTGGLREHTTHSKQQVIRPEPFTEINNKAVKSSLGDKGKMWHSVEVLGSYYPKQEANESFLLVCNSSSVQENQRNTPSDSGVEDGELLNGVSNKLCVNEKDIISDYVFEGHPENNTKKEVKLLTVNNPEEKLCLAVPGSFQELKRATALQKLKGKSVVFKGDSSLEDVLFLDSHTNVPCGERRFSMPATSQNISEEIFKSHHGRNDSKLSVHRTSSSSDIVYQGNINVTNSTHLKESSSTMSSLANQIDSISILTSDCISTPPIFRRMSLPSQTQSLDSQTSPLDSTNSFVDPNKQPFCKDIAEDVNHIPSPSQDSNTVEKLDLKNSDMQLEYVMCGSCKSSLAPDIANSANEITLSFASASPLTPRSSDYGSSGGGVGQRSTGPHHSSSQGGNTGSGKRGTFTRSLSNADVPPDEKADGSLSDTAVSHVHSMDGSRRKMAGVSSSSSKQSMGLGKKSSSTSQLSATVNTINCGLPNAWWDMWFHVCLTQSSVVLFLANRCSMVSPLLPVSDPSEVFAGMSANEQWGAASPPLKKGRKRRLGFGRKGKTSFTVHRSEEILPDDVRYLVKQGSSASSDGEGSQDGDRFDNQLSKQK